MGASPTFVEPAASIVWLMAIPLLWAVLCGVLALVRHVRSDAIAARVSIAGAGGVLALAVFQGVHLARLPRGNVAFQHLGRIARIGQLDVALDFTVDGVAAITAVVVALVACAATLHMVWRSQDGLAGRLAWLGLLTTSALLIVVGDGWPTILVGLQGMTLGTWAFGRGGRPGIVGAALAGDGAVLFGAFLLFWALGGVFGPSGYTADLEPRLQVIARPDTSLGPTAAITMPAYDGALVTIEDGPSKIEEPLRAPFHVKVEAGTYSFRVRGGVAATDLVVTQVALAAGATYVLTPAGPTTSLRILASELGRPGNPSAFRNALTSRTVAGARASTWIVLLVVTGILLRLVLLVARAPNHDGLTTTLEATVAWYVPARIASLIDPSAASGMLVALLAAGAALAFGGSAVAARTPEKALASVLASTSAVAIAAVGMGDSSAALVIGLAGPLAVAAAAASLESGGDVRWLGVACAGASGLLPSAGTSAGFAATIAAAIAAPGGGPSRLAIGASAALLVVTWVLVGLGAFRVYSSQLATMPPSRASDPKAMRVLAAVLAATALLLGAAMGAGTSPFGGTIVPFAVRIVGTGPRVTTGIASASVLVALLASVAGPLMARRMGSFDRPPRWVDDLGAIAGILRRLGSKVGGGTVYLASSVRAMDREVLEDMVTALGSVATGASRLVFRQPATDAAVAAEAPGMGHVAFGVLVATCALLGAVVVSSLLLGCEP